MISTVLIYSGNPAAEMSTETETDRANAALCSGFERLKPARSIIFQKKKISISVSGINFIVKICQTDVGKSMIS